MTIHSVSNKGWVVIPAELHRKYGLKPGAKVRIVDYGGVLAIVPAMRDPVQETAGMLKTRKELTRSLIEEHHRER